MVRRWAIVAVVGFAGCESLKHAPVPEPAPPVVGQSESNPTPTPPPDEFRRASLDKARVEGLRTPPPSPPSFPGKEDGGLGSDGPDPLTLAAECLGRGDRAGAATHLEAHVLAHPDQIMFRAQLADLLLRVGRDDAARVHFEQFAADARRSGGAPRNHLVHVHTRLMELAQRNDDRFAEVYHRGAGLLLLAIEQENAAERDDGFAEEMLCKAMRALVEARQLRPGDAGVRVRLAEVYDRMGNRRAAEGERAVAGAAATPTGAPPVLRP